MMRADGSSELPSSGASWLSGQGGPGSKPQAYPFSALANFLQTPGEWARIPLGCRDRQALPYSVVE